MVGFLQHLPVGGTFEKIDVFDDFEEEEKEDSCGGGYGGCGGCAVARGGGFAAEDGGAGGGGEEKWNGMVGLMEVVKSSEWWYNTWYSSR